MAFFFTEEQEQLRDSIRRFMDKECPRARIKQLEEEGRFPYELFDEMARLGWFSLPFPEEYGGTGCGPVEFAIIAEELGRYSIDIAAGLGIPIFCGLNLLHHGTEEQKKYYLPKMIRHEIRFSISITEPNAGSDAAALQTAAVKTEGGFVINGQKVFSSAAGLRNNIICLAARTEKNVAKKHHGISLFLLPADSKGVEVRKMRTLGRHILGTYEVFLTDVFVPEENVLGPVNEGWKVLLSGLEWERLFACANNLGMTETVVNDAAEYAKQREQFGQPIGNFQAIGHMLAEMRMDADISRLLTYRVAHMLEAGMPCQSELAMAKLFSSEAVVKASRQGMQILGGYGFTKDFDMERFFRDSIVVTVTAGTSQIQKNIIARNMGFRV